MVGNMNVPKNVRGQQYMNVNAFCVKPEQYWNMSCSENRREAANEMQNSNHILEEFLNFNGPPIIFKVDFWIIKLQYVYPVIVSPFVNSCFDNIVNPADADVNDNRNAAENNISTMYSDEPENVSGDNMKSWIWEVKSIEVKERG